MSEPARVLIVDDNDAILKRASLTLSAACRVVGAVKDGPAALEAAESLRPDVIVLDISMPGMTGLEVASALREGGSTAAVVFLTIHDEAVFVEAAKAAGALGYVTKGRLASDLLPAVRDAIEGRPFVSARH